MRRIVRRGSCLRPRRTGRRCPFSHHRPTLTIDDTAQDISAVASMAKAMQNALQKLPPLAPGSYADGDDSTAPTTPSEAHTRTKAERR